MCRLASEKASRIKVAKAYLQKVQNDHGLQDTFVVVYQHRLRKAWLGHDVMEQRLQHALAHGLVQAPVHDAPGTADEAHLVERTAVTGDSRQLRTAG